MATTIDTRNFFNSEEFADLIVRADGKDFNCHKIIVSSESKYFADRLKKIAPPKDGNMTVMVLNNAPWTWVEAVIRYLYTFDYGNEVSKALMPTSMFDVGVAQLAKRYGLAELEEKAITNFEGRCEQLNDIIGALRVLEQLQQGIFATYSNEKLRGVITTLKAKHMPKVVKDLDLALVSDQAPLMRRCLWQAGYVHSVTQKWFMKCQVCGKGDIRGEIGDPARLCCGKEMRAKACWVEKD